MRETTVRSGGGNRGGSGAAAYGLAAAVVLAWGASCAGQNAQPTTESTPGHQDTAAPMGMAAYTPGVPGYEAQRATGQAEIGEAMRALETAGDACGLACPAVDTLRRGVSHMCAVKEIKEDEKVCKDDRAQLVAVEARLKGPCGSCVPRRDAGEPDTGL